MQLLPDDFFAVCTGQKIPVVFRLQQGYDHSLLLYCNLYDRSAQTSRTIAECINNFRYQNIFRIIKVIYEIAGEKFKTSELKKKKRYPLGGHRAAVMPHNALRTHKAVLETELPEA